MNNKAVPMRRCIGCFQSKPKAELDRFVNRIENDTNIFVYDSEGKMDGRGVYLCKGSQNCEKKAVKKKHMEFRR